MKQGTTLNQSQRLGQHLSPQQVRFVRLLEMSGPEIEEEIRHELDDNPALEAETSSADMEEIVLATDDAGDIFSESADQIQAADYGNADDIPQYLMHASNHSADDEEDRPQREQREDSPTLVEELTRQLRMVDALPRQLALAEYLIGYLDDNGRITRSLADIAEDLSINAGLTVTRAELSDALNIIKYKLDPAGVGAVDLRECLMIQLRRKQPKTLPLRAAEEIITDNFDLFSKKHYDRLQSVLGIDRDTFDSALDIILSLDPKPGGSLADSGGSPAAHITPDFVITPVEDGSDTTRFSITLNQHIPALTVEQSFTIDPADAAGRVFIKKKREEATSFIGLIERRSTTLMSVMQAIVTIQARFFETEDPVDIRPMILKDVANMTGLDISVISRATSTKYIATPGGIYPLKIFFNDRPIEDDDASSAEIMDALRKLIESEDKQHPLSDRILTDKLNAGGYNLARRTVAKYRERMNIPVARLRKEYM